MYFKELSQLFTDVFLSIIENNQQLQLNPTFYAVTVIDMYLKELSQLFTDLFLSLSLKTINKYQRLNHILIILLCSYSYRYVL